MAMIRARSDALLFGALVAATDILPPRLRYGYVHPLTRRMLQRPLPHLEYTRSAPMGEELTASGTPETLTCVLAAGALDIGGIGSVVEMLATGLPKVGIRPVVVCTDDGPRAARLRSRGTRVAVVGSRAEAGQVLRDLAPQVIQLHGAPEHLEEAAMSTSTPLVPVLHNTEIHFSRARWRRFTRLLGRSAAAIAVSELVREFHGRHVPLGLRGRIDVVPNAVAPQAAVTENEKRAARAELESTLGGDLEGDIIFVSLARYDSQKNVAGLVASFLACVSDPSVRLIIAGEPSDWAEVRRADAIRRSSPRAKYVSLLGSSDARTLLAAADGFVLDSFFEGWPVAATEAASMGLPLVLSDFGGARELIARDPAHSVLIPNPCGLADAVSDSAVARARRGCRNQSNAAELGSAIDRVAARARAGEGPIPESADVLMETMMTGHAEVLRRATGVGGDKSVVISHVERGMQ
jgi:glycosyltransferase involved in cell wall biosynthesis